MDGDLSTPVGFSDVKQTAHTHTPQPQIIAAIRSDGADIFIWVYLQK